MVLAAVALIVHLAAFGLLFREQDTTEFLIPDEDLFPTDEAQPSHSRSRSEATADTRSHSLSENKLKSPGKLDRSVDEDNREYPHRRRFFSSRSLVNSPSPQATPPHSSEPAQSKFEAQRRPSVELAELNSGGIQRETTKESNAVPAGLLMRPTSADI